MLKHLAYNNKETAEEAGIRMLHDMAFKKHKCSVCGKIITKYQDRRHWNSCWWWGVHFKHIQKWQKESK